MDYNELVRQLKSGNGEAQIVFWQRYWDEVYPICARILKNPVDGTDVAVDLLHDFMNYYVHKLNDAKAMRAYLRMMAIRRSTTYREKFAKMTPLKHDPVDLDSTNPEEASHWRVLTPRLRACLGELTPKARQALRLRYGRQQNNVEIGRRLGGSKQYIGRLIQQSLIALKRCIESTPRVAESEMK